MATERQEEAGPASPPLPTRHTAVTPGPRASRLQEVFASRLKHTVDKITWENFAACYPTIATRAPRTLETVQRQMVGLFEEHCNVSFRPFRLSLFTVKFCGGVRKTEGKRERKNITDMADGSGCAFFFPTERIRQHP